MGNPIVPIYLSVGSSTPGKYLSLHTNGKEATQKTLRTNGKEATQKTLRTNDKENNFRKHQKKSSKKKTLEKITKNVAYKWQGGYTEKLHSCMHCNKSRAQMIGRIAEIRHELAARSD